MLAYPWRVLVATDQWLNALTGGALNETISARAARLRDKGVFIGCALCKFLDFIKPGHCDAQRQ